MSVQPDDVLVKMVGGRKVRVRQVYKDKRLAVLAPLSASASSRVSSYIVALGRDGNVPGYRPEVKP